MSSPSVLLMMLAVSLFTGGRALEAHQDACHQRHSCPSDHGTYVCGDTGRCDQCPDNQFCLAAKPRLAASPAPMPVAPPSIQPPLSGEPTVCFTPGGNCTDLMVQAIDGAKTSILVQAYSFTSTPIAKALLDAHKRGVQVQVILDKSQRTEKYSSADFLANQGVPTLIDAAHAIAHNKIIIIDAETVLTGSFNFTKSAQDKNAENVIILRDTAVAAQYRQNWEAHRQHSQPYRGRGVRSRGTVEPYETLPATDTPSAVGHHPSWRFPESRDNQPRLFGSDGVCWSLLGILSAWGVRTHDTTPALEEHLIQG